MLTPEKIQELANRKGVRRIAVENFLGTLGNEGGAREAKMNMYQDASGYKWNAATQLAILRGIDLYYARSKKEQKHLGDALVKILSQGATK
jgi:hypothetical protein